MSDRAIRPAKRLPSFDALRGLIMVLMALDHASFFIAGVHPAEMWNAPLPDYEAFLPFATRYVSHLCAPGFLLLLGAGMVLFADSRRKAGWPEGRIIRHFVLRGAVLVLVQLLLVDPAWMLPSLLSPSGPEAGGGSLIVYVGVLFALGASMIAGAFLVRLGPLALLGAGCGAILLTQVLVPPPGGDEAAVSLAARLLWLPGLTKPLFVNYPLLPWLGTALLGMALAKHLAGGTKSRPRTSGLLAAGGLCLALFLSVRLSGGFGNLHTPAGGGLMAFLAVTKYPPSLAFLLLTLGGNLMLLGLFARSPGALEHRFSWLLDFGRSPLFFYVTHLYLYGFLSLAYPEGTRLIGIYPVWLLGLLLLLPACRGYARFRARSGPGSLWRLF